MHPLTRLHGLAAPRGDGLRSELLEFLRNRGETVEANPAVTEICRHREATPIQAGPNPAPDLTGVLGGNVLRFPAATGK